MGARCCHTYSTTRGRQTAAAITQLPCGPCMRVTVCPISLRSPLGDSPAPTPFYDDRKHPRRRCDAIRASARHCCGARDRRGSYRAAKCPIGSTGGSTGAGEVVARGGRFRSATASRKIPENSEPRTCALALKRGHCDRLAYQGRRELSREEPAIRGWFVSGVVIPIVIAVVVAGDCSFRAFLR